MSNKKKTSKDDKLLYSKNMIYSTYYMLAYNIKELQYFDIDSIENIDGMSMIELLGAIFVKALENCEDSLDVIDRKYECSSKPKGKIDIIKSYSTGSIASSMLHYQYNSFDSYDEFYKIVKLAIETLLNINYSVCSGQVNNQLSDETYDSLIREIGKFEDIPSISYSDYLIISKTCEVEQLEHIVLLGASKLVIENLLGKDSNSENELFSLNDNERYSRLFEGFLYSYFENELCKDGVIIHNNAISIKTSEGNSRTFEPDIVIEDNNNCNILDAKWYGVGDPEHKGNIHQISSYLYMQMAVDSIKGLQRGYRGILVCAMNENHKKENKPEGLVEYKLENPKVKGDYTESGLYVYRINMDTEIEKIRKQLECLYDSLLLNQNS